MIHIETPRLILRDWKEEGLQAFRELNSDKEVMRYFPKVYSEEETDAFYEAIKKEFREYNFGLYAVEVKESKEVYSFTAKINKPSENVMKKIGMQYVKEFDHPRLEPNSKLCRHVLYVIRNTDKTK